MLHSDPDFPVTVGDRVTVGHRAVVHGCTVEDDSLVGMGAVLLNGVVLGAGSLVAAGSVLPEGTVVPPGSLVAGVPERQAAGHRRRARADPLGRRVLRDPGPRLPRRGRRSPLTEEIP